jgi:hypothetical protein
MLWFLTAALVPVAAAAQVRVHPTGVNVNTQGATTVFLTFGGVRDVVAVEALWCGALEPAAPDIGMKCDPATIFGSLPARLDQSRPSSGPNGFTDIMSIPASVTRRAYQAAARGEPSAFFYVRRFRSTIGGRDEYVAVTCRLAGGGARVPFSIVDVQVSFAVAAAMHAVRPGETPPGARAELAYTGTGRLRGRWEVVRPGDEPPTAEDLLPEAALPIERRAAQRRYAEVGRFNVLLPPTGRATLPGPDPARLPVDVDGTYLLLLRIEAADDKETDSSLAAAGAGTGVVTSGAVAGFPMPVLRYLVGAASADAAARGLVAIGPAEGASFAAAAAVEFAWSDDGGASLYRLEITAPDGTRLHEALVPAGVRGYRAPPWLAARAPNGQARWRVVALAADGQIVRASGWRRLLFSQQPDLSTITPGDQP